MNSQSSGPPRVGLSSAAIALNRFGLGARPDDAPPADPRGWITGQFTRFEVRPARFAGLADAGALLDRYREERAAARGGAGGDAAAAKAAAQVTRRDFREEMQALYREGVQARADAALGTEAPFVERMVHFWSNHFCVSADNPRVTALTPAFERDAIRPHVLGRFADMVLAAERHPAMLLYLNQDGSVGPNSQAAARAAIRQPGRRRGLNENLAREAMELHTLGVRSGYTQADVTEFARALTGWSVGPGGAFAFRADRHEPGERVILGRRYPQQGGEQARTALLAFAAAPATATHIATKLARHFADDESPPAMVARLAADFTDSGGNLPSLYRALVASPEAWVPTPTKFKTPWEWTISALRGLGHRSVGQMQVAALQAQLGQRVWRPGAPAGWDDVAASWAGPDALVRRVEVAQRLALPLGQTVDARTLAPRLLPASLSQATAQQIARSESPASAVALMLASPDFLRR